MSNGIRSLPRYKAGGSVDPTRRDFLKRILGGIGGLWASRFGFPGGDEPVRPHLGKGDGPQWIDDYDNPYDWSETEEWLLWVKEHLREAGIDPDDVPDDVFADFIDEVTPVPNVDFGLPSTGPSHYPVTNPTELQDIIDRDLKSWDDLSYPPLKNDPKVMDDILENRYDYNRKLDELLASGDARFYGEYVGGPSSSPFADADPEDVALYKRLQRLSRTSETRGAQERQARRGGEMFFGPSHDRPGILESPSVRPSPSTAGRRAGRRGLMSLLGIGAATALTSHPLSALADVMMSPTQLGSGDLPEEGMTEKEKLELMKYYRDMNESRRDLPGMDVPTDFFDSVTQGRSGIPMQTMGAGR